MPARKAAQSDYAMKIFLLCYEYPPVGGGGGVGAQQYAEAWADHGHHVTVLTSRAPGLAARETVSGVEIIRVAAVGRRDRATSTLFSMACYNLAALIYVLLHRRALKGFDVINTHFSIPTGPVAWAAARLLHLPNVLTIIGGDIYDPSKKLSPHRSPFFRMLNRWIINAADRVIAISSDTKRRAQQYYRIRRPIHVIQYGFKPLVPCSSASLPALRADRFYLIAVGRLVPRKGFDVLIRAMTQVPDDVELLLVGDGPLAEPLRVLAAQEGVTRRVHMLGYQTREWIRQLMQSCHCFVLSSLHEGLGIVVQEAMEAGLPMVATNNGGQVDLIQHQRNGVLVEAGDAEALAGAIRSIYWDPALAESMCRNNREDIRPLYIEHNNQLYLQVFQEVAGPSGDTESTIGDNEPQPLSVRT